MGIEDNEVARNILVTGGAGFVGSHTVLELLNRDFNVVVVDNCSNAYKHPGQSSSDEKLPESLKRVQKLTGKSVVFYKVDITDLQSLADVFKKHSFSCVIHFAGLKAVGESVQNPLMYYQTNLIGSLNLIQCMQTAGVKNIIFSSSATVYGQPESLPITEEAPVGGCTNPYGKSKFFIEHFLQDHANANKATGFTSVLLRYFNPIGAHESGHIGEDPSGLPNNLMPYVAQVAVGKLPCLNVFGNDYDTPDGTGVRDYIHVVDLAIGHVAALDKLISHPDFSGVKVYNLGTGNGYSVLEMVAAMKKASGRDIPYRVQPRREGDVATVYADCSLAERELGWRATRDLDTMCRDLWKWQSQNKNGYKPVIKED